jgi:hypothetical protein
MAKKAGYSLWSPRDLKFGFIVLARAGSRTVLLFLAPAFSRNGHFQTKASSAVTNKPECAEKKYYVASYS